jgi:segregation and condensation protein A
MTTNYFVKLDCFEGPLDLLLHLIRVNELNIFAIDLYILTSQYIDFLRLVKFKNLQEASSFLEMAACLLEIKSKRLLPTEKTDEEDKKDEEDTEISLEERLLTYDLFKKAGSFFAKNDSFGVLSYSGLSEKTRLDSLQEGEDVPIKGDIATLLILYEQMLSSLGEKRPVVVKKDLDSLSISDVISRIVESLKKIDIILFADLYPNMGSRQDLVAYISGMLQLVRDGHAKIYQEQMMGPLWVYNAQTKEQDLCAKISPPPLIERK